jgi:hypothetical protein
VLLDVEFIRPVDRDTRWAAAFVGASPTWRGHDDHPDETIYHRLARHDSTLPRLSMGRSSSHSAF